MTSEFAPSWSNPRMTKAQIKKYLKEMEKKRKEAQLKLEEYKNSWEMEKDLQKIKELEKELENL